MIVQKRVHRVRYALELALGAGALLWSGAALFVLLVLRTPLWLAAAGAAAVLGGLVWRARFAWCLDRVALWVEEQAPQLQYALVTAVDSRFATSMDAAIQPLVARIPIEAFVRRTAVRITVPALAAMSAAFAAYLIAPTGAGGAASGAPRAGAAATVIPNRLVPLRGTLSPPAYAGMPDVALDEPSTITGLQGSRVSLGGHGDPDGVVATICGQAESCDPRRSEGALRATHGGGGGGGSGWTLSFTMSDTVPGLLRLHDRKYSRLIIIDPKVDEAPRVNLRLPARDTTLRIIAGNLNLASDISDDIGLGRARFEYIISSGSQESFTFREGTLGDRRLGGPIGRMMRRLGVGSAATKARLELSIPFATFKLNEGDRISLRAVAWDNNTLTGPGKGTSETRTIRIARKEEYDTLSVNRAPLSADTAMMSLRMLIIATEKLKAQRGKMERAAFVEEAKKLGGQSESIRRKIQQIIDETTGGGQIAADTLLTTALGAMWDATRELYIASPDGALPPMYVAYKALQALRNTKRYYIRGLQRPIIVNVERVRLSGGTDTGKATPRLPRIPERSVLDQLRGAYSAAVRLLGTAPDSAMNVLMMMRVASLRTAPALAASLGDAVAAMQSGRDVTAPLLRARRLLGSTTNKLDSLPAWSGAWQQ